MTKEQHKLEMTARKMRRATWTPEFAGRGALSAVVRINAALAAKRRAEDMMAQFFRELRRTPVNAKGEIRR